MAELYDVALKGIIGAGLPCVLLVIGVIFLYKEMKATKEELRVAREKHEEEQEKTRNKFDEERKSYETDLRELFVSATATIKDAQTMMASLTKAVDQLSTLVRAWNHEE